MDDTMIFMSNPFRVMFKSLIKDMALPNRCDMKSESHLDMLSTVTDDGERFVPFSHFLWKRSPVLDRPTNRYMDR